MSHECPADDCGVSCDQVLMCRQHWRMVPRVMRTEVNGAWGAYRRASAKGIGRMDAWRDYAVARQAAVSFVNGRLSRT